MLSEARGRRGGLADWTVEERLALVARGRAAALAVVMVRPGAADAVVWMS